MNPVDANTPKRRHNRAAGALSHTRLIGMAVVGLIVAVGLSFVIQWVYAVILGWAAACLVFIVWVWVAIAPMDDKQTQRYATREDPNRRTSYLLILVASIASLVIVIYVLIESKNQTGTGGTGLVDAIAVGSAALSWTLVHTLFTLRYARLYYESKFDGAAVTEPRRGISFNQDEDPRYTDFAYFAFTLGMTYQVSDTDISTHHIRSTALRHSLLSYLFGSVILGTIINLIGGLGH